MNKNLKNITKAYAFYKKNVEDPVDSSIYKQITTEYHNYIIEKVIDGEKVGLPNRCGHLLIKGRKRVAKIDEKGNITGVPPHYSKTKELWERNPEAKRLKTMVYCMNEHSGQIVYSFFWSKKRVTAKFKDLYTLRMVRRHKRKLWEYIMNGRTYVTK